MTVSYNKNAAVKLGYYTSELEGGTINFPSDSLSGAQWWVGGHDGYRLEDALGTRSGDHLDPAGIETLVRLADGFRPGNAPNIPLVRNAGSARRVALHDFTLSAPKSVSVAWALAGDGLRTDMEAVHLQAARSFLSVMADQIHCRLGAGGKLRCPCPVVAVLFPHQTSRALDPQIHIHCVLINLTITQSGRGAAIEVRRALDWIGAAACVYHAQLAHGLKSLGFRIQQSEMLFELQEIPEQLLSEFSQRRRSILLALDQAAMERGMAPGRAIATRRQVEVQVLRTRPKKSSRSAAVLRRWWRMRAGRFASPLTLGERVALVGRRSEGKDPLGPHFGRWDRHRLGALPDRSVAATPELLKEWAAEVLATACRQDGGNRDRDPDRKDGLTI